MKPMSIEANKAVVTRYWMELWSDKHDEIVDEIISETVVFHFPPGQAHQPASMHEWLKSSRVAFPDVRFRIHELIAEGNLVVCRWSYQATHTGTFLGQAASGRIVTDQGINIFRLEGGKIAEMWMSGDSLGLLQQLGLITKAD